jgi:tripartite-type tricarboxylate transporter receptor subunit TctC
MGILFRTGLALCASISAMHAQAQDYPNRPVKIIVGYVPGATGPDFSARTVAPKLSQLLGQPFIVENRAGAGGTLATTFVVKAPADGYTLLLGETGQLEIAPYLHKNLPYDSLRDLTAIAMMTDGAGIVIASNAKTTRITTLVELIREAKAQPGKFTYASAGIGSTHHLVMESLKDGAGIDVVHVPYKGGGQALPAFLGGEVSLMVAALQTMWPHVRAGSAHVLAVTAPVRLPVIPNVPAIAEVIKDFGFESQLGILGPAGLPREIVNTLSRTIKAALESPDVREKLSAEGTRTIRWSTPEEYTETIRQNLKRYERAVKIANIRPE